MGMEGQFNDLTSRDSNGERWSQIRLDMGTEMDRYMGVYRNEEGMQTLLKSLEGLQEAI